MSEIIKNKRIDKNMTLEMVANLIDCPISELKDIEEGKFDCIYACGPLPMLKAVREKEIKKDIPCQISLEERMGCGLGVCLGCAVKTARSSKENPEYWHVCKGGPVFEAKDVEI